MRKPGRPSDSSSERESPWSRARVPRPRSDTERTPRPRSDTESTPRARTDDERAAAYIERSARDAPHVREAVEVPREIRLYGLNACLAAFAKRPEALRKVYLTEARIATLKPVLAWCVKHRLGYRVVEDADLDKLTSSRHHEGVCFEMLRSGPLELVGPRVELLEPVEANCHLTRTTCPPSPVRAAEL